MVSREDVFEAYRYLLGREPESEEVIAHHQTHPSVTVLRQGMVRSEEFLSFYRSLGRDANELTMSATDTFGPKQDIETDTEGALKDEMWQRIAQNWRKLGEDAPHWSVLTQENFRPDEIEANHDVFMETRFSDIELIDNALARLPNPDELLAGPCLEVGCGVGRATRGLAERFGQVLGVDVSGPHLDIARDGMAAEGYSNVEFRRMERIEDYADLGTPRFFFSRIVLQHNPPPVQAAILRAILNGLAPSGAALFQIVTYIGGYSFSAEDYLKNTRTGIEMHALPQDTLFDILHRTGMQTVEINRDDSSVCEPGDSNYRSHLVLARKV